MIKLSACIEMLFNEVGFYDRFEAAKNAGLDAVEFWRWTGKDIGRIKELKDKYKLVISDFCVAAEGDELADEFNAKRLLYRGVDKAFKHAVEQTIPLAKQLDTQTLIVTVGQERNDVTRYEQHANIVLNLKAAASLLEDAGIILVVEPLNVLANHRGYFLPSSYEAFEIVEEVGSPNVKILYDIYHQQISEGNIIPTIQKYSELIGHFHTADVPGRHELGTGELNYRNIFAAIDKTGYDKYVGMEYAPTKNTAETVKEALALTK